MDPSDDGIMQQRESCDSKNDNNDDIPMDSRLEILLREYETRRKRTRPKDFDHMPFTKKNLVFFHRKSFFSNHGANYILDDPEFLTSAWESHRSRWPLNKVGYYWIIFSICTFLLDVIFDIVVAVLHYINGNTFFFTLTVIFVATPTIIITSISLRWYIVDAKNQTPPPISTLGSTFRLLLLLLQLGPIIRYIDTLQYSLQFGRKFGSNLRDKSLVQKYYQYMIFEAADASMLRMFEGFMEAAPQLVLNIYILVLRPDRTLDLEVAVQCFSICFSLISLPWCLVSYPPIFREKNIHIFHKLDSSLSGMLVQFLWRFCMIVSRVMALALFASKFGHLILWIAACHWLVMFVWIFTYGFDDNTLEQNVFEKLVYNSLLAITSIFSYFDPINKPTRRRYAFYYSFMFIENSILIFMWFHACDPLKWYRVPAFAGYFVAFFCGLIFMKTYYRRFHPMRAIKRFQEFMVDYITCHG